MDNSTEPWQAGGALMLGGRQGCYGGCMDQAFTGFMDEVQQLVHPALKAYLQPKLALLYVPFLA